MPTMREIYQDGYKCGYDYGDSTDAAFTLFGLEVDEKEYWWEAYELGKAARDRDDGKTQEDLI